MSELAFNINRQGQTTEPATSRRLNIPFVPIPGLVGTGDRP